jgi:hypothetical protein
MLYPIEVPINENGCAEVGQAEVGPPTPALFRRRYHDIPVFQRRPFPQTISRRRRRRAARVGLRLELLNPNLPKGLLAAAVGLRRGASKLNQRNDMQQNR